jgi:hypothetical protein
MDGNVVRTLTRVGHRPSELSACMNQY